VFKPEVPNVFFVGLTQPWGAIMPLSEIQAKWIASYLRGEYALPSGAEMHRHMDREAQRMARRYVKSKRHTMQVEARDYMWEARARDREGQDPGAAQRSGAAGRAACRRARGGSRRVIVSPQHAGVRARPRRAFTTAHASARSADEEGVPSTRRRAVRRIGARRLGERSATRDRRAG
jgi:hypothetical protein